MLTRKQYAGLVAVVGVTGLIGGGLSNVLVAGRTAQAQEEPATAGEIEAKGFWVVDKNGTHRVGLTMSRDNQPSLVFLGKDREIRVLVGVLDDGSPNLIPGSKDGKPRVSLGVSAGGSPGLPLSDNDGNTRASRLVPPNGRPSLSLRDRDGQVLRQAP
jgi:hypothetical protein